MSGIFIQIIITVSEKIAASALDEIIGCIQRCDQFIRSQWLHKQTSVKADAFTIHINTCKHCIFAFIVHTVNVNEYINTQYCFIYPIIPANTESAISSENMIIIVDQNFYKTISVKQNSNDFHDEEKFKGRW